MTWIREYVMQVIGAAMICGVIRLLVGTKGAVVGTVRLLTAVFMLLTILSPISGIALPDLRDWTDSITQDGEDLVNEGIRYQRQELVSYIKAHIEAYILDKATALGAEISVQVHLSGDALPAPNGVTVEGAISPYGKTKLSGILEKDLGIPMEAQTWISNQS